MPASIASPPEDRSPDGIRALMEAVRRALDALGDGGPPDSEQVERLRELLDRRATMVAEIDGRLTRCVKLIDEGLRDEAIGWAADEPEVGEAAGLLDLQAAPQAAQSRWWAALARQGIARPLAPQMELVAVVAEGRQQAADLKPHLDRLRRLNLEGRPLAERIRTLRKLQRLDPLSPVWIECLRAHEASRAIQIERECRVLGPGDEALLEALAKELEQEWLEPPPRRIQSQVRSTLDAFRARRLAGELETVSREIGVAFAARDLEAGRQIARRWEQLAAESGGDVAAAASLPRAAAGLEWVRRRNRYASLLAEIDSLLAEHPPTYRAREERIRTVTRLGRELDSLAEKLPGEFDGEALDKLLDRAERTSNEFDRETWFRRWRLYATLVAVAIVVAGLGGSLIGWQARERAVVDTVAACASLRERIAAGEIVDVDSLGGNLSSGVAADPRVVTCLAELRAAVAGQDQRRAQLAGALGRARTAIAGLGDQREDPLAPWPEGFADATRALAEVESGRLAVTQAEMADVVRVRGALHNRARRWIVAADDAVAAAVGRLAEDLEHVRNTVGPDRAEAARGLAAVEAKLGDLKQRALAAAAPGACGEYAGRRLVSSAEAALLESESPLARQIVQLQGMIDKQDRFAAAAALLEAAEWDPAAYARRLRAIGEEFPDLPEAQEFARTAECEPAWQGIEAWAGFTRGLGPLTNATPADAATLLADFRALPDAARDLPAAKEFAAAVLPALERLATRDLAQVQANLSRFFSDAWLGELKWIVRTDGGQSFYYAIETAAPGTRKFKAVQEFPEGRAWHEEFVYNSTVKECSVAPGFGLCQAVEPSIEGLAARAHGIQLDDELLDILKKTLAADTVDALPRLVTVRRILKLAAANSRAFKDSTRRLEVDLGLEVDDIPGLPLAALGSFVPPQREQDEVYLAAVARAERKLALVAAAMPTIAEAVARDKALLARPYPGRLERVGLVTRTPEGEKQAKWHGSPPSAGVVWWVAASGQVRRAGVIGTDTAFEPEATLGPRGTPLYVEVPAAGGKAPP